MNFDLRWSKHPWFTAVPFLFSLAWARLGLHKSERPHWTSWFTISPMESPRSPMFHSFHQACSRWALCHAFCVLWHLWHGSKVKCFVFNEGRFFLGVRDEHSHKAVWYPKLWARNFMEIYGTSWCLRMYEAHAANMECNLRKWKVCSRVGNCPVSSESSQFRLHGAPNSVDPQGEHTQTSPATSSDTRDKEILHLC